MPSVRLGAFAADCGLKEIEVVTLRGASDKWFCGLHFWFSVCLHLDLPITSGACMSAAYRYRSIKHSAAQCACFVFNLFATPGVMMIS